ncbi:MAG: NAD(P)/FAD-dependent oxidoreductase [Clostridia bacterium]|nr:NAD(P)/FAD-dependent oxidoreductase [Clostridia bacterium]
MQDVIILGCGVIGAACAYTLSRYDVSVTVLEKSNDVANGTTKANSAIVHAGYDPRPGTAIARLNVEGNRMMEDLCRRLDVPFKRIGSHVLAFSEADLSHLQVLYERGVKNGVPDLRILTGEEARLMEPNLSEAVVGSLYAPTAGIVSPWELTLAMAEVAVRNGVELILEAPTTAIRQEEDGTFTVTTPKGDFRAKTVLNATGVDAEAVCGLLGVHEFTLTPNRGEYYLLDKSEGTRVRSVIFQCPDENGKGVLVSPTVHGNLIVGPNAEAVSGADATENTAQGLSFVKKQAIRSVPTLSFRENIRNFAGVRANHAEDDFLIGESSTFPGFFHLAGIKSPGLTAAPAIAKEAAEYVASRTPLIPKAEFSDGRRVIRFKSLSEEEKRAVIARNPLYGRVICRCETVTEGEIVAALQSPIPPTTVNGVKRRVGAGMGRCQGGFCSPRVQEILARELGIPMEAIPLDQPGSNILTGRTKEEYR